MNLILTSDFPSTPTPQIVERLRAVAGNPRIAWIPPFSDAEGTFFADARARFGALGFDQLELVDIDEDRDDVQIAYLHEFDIIYLSGGDPVRFRYNAMRAGLAGRLRQCAAIGRTVIGASGGALLLTPNVSLYRLQHESVSDVVATRARFDALGGVDYELLPHAGTWDEAFMNKLRAYSDAIDSDIVALADGAAMIHSLEGAVQPVGSIIRYRKGTIIEA
jgi:peptidase E